MCDFFSAISDGRGKVYYFSYEIRKQVLSGELRGKNIHDTDSHSQIATYFNINVDECNKWEFNPLTKRFKVDQINTVNDRESVEGQIRALDFSDIVPELIIKPIINPFADRHLLNKPPKKPTKKDIELLKQWASVRDSVRASVRASVWASVRDSVRASVRASVWASVGASVGDSVRASVWASVGASVGDSVGDSVRASVGDSVGDSVGAYTGSFFALDEWRRVPLSVLR
jgi:hypothetical protein